MSPVLVLKCKLRSLAGVRQTRAVPRRGRKPPIGVGIICDDVRMIVPAGMTEEMWEWLMDRGWREVTYRPDRRNYRLVPASCAAELVDAIEEMRADLLQEAIDRAELRVCYRADPDMLPPYVRCE